MRLKPRGDYYVWHCDWCDSTNYTIWTRIEREDLACAACHKKFSDIAEDSPAFIPQSLPENSGTNLSW